MQHYRIKVTALLCPLIFLCSCAYRETVTLTDAQRATVEERTCLTQQIVMPDTEPNKRVAARWHKLCPSIKINYLEDKSPGNSEALYVTVDGDFVSGRVMTLHKDMQTPRYGRNGFFCTWEPMIQTITLGLIPLVCVHDDDYRVCVRSGSQAKCVEEFIRNERFHYLGIIPLLTLGVPHAIAWMANDRIEDLLIAQVVHLLEK